MVVKAEPILPLPVPLLLAHQQHVMLRLVNKQPLLYLVLLLLITKHKQNVIYLVPNGAGSLDVKLVRRDLFRLQLLDVVDQMHMYIQVPR